MEQERGYPELRQVVIDCRNARASAEFYRQLLGFVYKAGHEPQPDGDADASDKGLAEPSGCPGHHQLGISTGRASFTKRPGPTTAFRSNSTSI